jgi:hypothetical protein
MYYLTKIIFECKYKDITIIIVIEMDDSYTILTFGKYNGRTYDFIRQTDVAYCNWALKQANSGHRMAHFQQWLKTTSRKVTCECCNGSGFVDAI